MKHKILPGQIVGADGSVIFKEVLGNFFLHSRNYDIEWSGVVDVLSGEMPYLFEGTFVTEDGRRGNLFATEYKFGDTTISVDGSCEPPFDF